MTALTAHRELHLITSETPAIRAVAVPDAAHERIAQALRGARVRTGLVEQQVLDKLALRGLEVSLTQLRQAEGAGVVELALASALADLYGTTTDGLAGRRVSRQLQHSLPALRL